MATPWSRRRKRRDADAAQLARFGYGQELRRVLNLFENFAVAFCYISPVVGIYSLFVLGVGTAGPRYLWLLPIVVLGQLFVALVFAELGSHYPIAGALFQWGKNLIGPNYGWWVGWIYGWALIMTVASVDTGFVIYAGPLINNIFHTTINSADPNQILVFTVVLITRPARVQHRWGQLPRTHLTDRRLLRDHRHLRHRHPARDHRVPSRVRLPLLDPGRRDRGDQSARCRLRWQLVARRRVCGHPGARLHLLWVRVGR